MKIVYYLPSLYIPGGLERVITEKANYFADKLGYDVTILTSEQQGKNVYYPLSPKVRHYDLNVVIDGGKSYPFIFKLIFYPFKYYLFKSRFARFLEKNQFDITISTLRREVNFINSLHDGSAKIGEFHVTRNAYHSISEKRNNRLKRVHSYLQRRFIQKLKLFSKIILLTREEQENWPELNNTVVIHNPLTLITTDIAALDNRRVIAIGRYAYQKGFDLLIQAWNIIHQKHPDWELHIYGQGDRIPYQEQVQVFDLTDSCFLHPACSRIEEKYIECSIFAFSSRYEGFGMVLVEAMACGVPPVSFDCPCGPKDIITDGIDGILVENGNVEMLADRICFLIENEDIRKGMGKKAQVNIVRFNIENIARQWDDLFKGLIEDKGGKINQ